MHSEIIVFTGFFLVACSPALGVIAGILWNRRASQKTSHWSRTHGVIEESDVRIEIATEENRSDKYFVTVRYSYIVGDATLRNDEIWLNSQHQMSGLDEANEVARRYPVGRHVTVFYNPKNPARAVLDPGFHAGAYTALFRNAWYFAVPPIIMLLVLVFVLLAGLAAS